MPTASDRLDPSTGGQVGRLLWSSIASALSLSCLRTHGQEATAQLEFEASRRHHEELLDSSGDALAGSSSAAWRCARVHLQVDELVATDGRVPQAWEDENGRVWLRSGPARVAPPEAWTPSAPSAIPAVFAASVGQARARARQATTAARIGGVSVQFVHTHDLTDGDVWDAGYFVEHASPLAAGEHYRRERATHFARNVAARQLAPVLDVATTLEEATDAALRAATWKMVVLAEQLGVVGAAAVVEHALRTVLTAYFQWLPAALGLEPLATPLDAARLYAGAALLIGDEVTVTDDGDHALARHANDRMWRGHGTVPQTIREAVVRGWSGALPHYCWDLHARLGQPLERLGSQLVVRFDRSGPGD